MVATKFIANIAAIALAIVVAGFVNRLSDVILDLLVVHQLKIPPSSYFYTPELVRLDVICAVLIPISIAVW
jgi:hypothetical protein